MLLLPIHSINHIFECRMLYSYFMFCIYNMNLQRHGAFTPAQWGLTKRQYAANMPANEQLADGEYVCSFTYKLKLKFALTSFDESLQKLTLNNQTCSLTRLSWSFKSQTAAEKCLSLLYSLKIKYLKEKRHCCTTEWKSLYFWQNRGEYFPAAAFFDGRRLVVSLRGTARVHF